MSAVTQQTISIGKHLPWVAMTLNYSDRLVALIPEDKLDWRPEDPNGHFTFSFRELAMHIADSRLMFARQLSGDNSEEGYWSLVDDDDPGKEQGMVWKFREGVTKEAILESLARARQELQPFLDMPLDRLQTSTEGTQAVFDNLLKQFAEKGEDASAIQERGPATINRVLFAIACHESGHRGSLQTLLRMNGVDARGEM